MHRLSDLLRTDGSSGQQFIGQGLGVSLATATQIPQMCRPWYAGPRCAWLKLVLSIAPCAKPMESDSVPSRSWADRPRFNHSDNHDRRVTRAPMVQTTANRDSATNSAC